MNKINEQSIKMKMNSDFSSKISCLPGTMTKEVEDENKKRHKKSSGVQKYNAETKEVFIKSIIDSVPYKFNTVTNYLINHYNKL